MRHRLIEGVSAAIGRSKEKRTRYRYVLRKGEKSDAILDLVALRTAVTICRDASSRRAFDCMDGVARVALVVISKKREQMRRCCGEGGR